MSAGPFIAQGARQMKSLDFSRYVLYSCVAAAILAGCGGSQPPIGAPGAMHESPAIPSHANHSASSTGSDLLYASGGTGTKGAVYVYSYPQGDLVQTLTGLIVPGGECVDASGDVFITAYANPSFTSSKIFEYVHGGKTPLATLNDPGIANGCAVDPRSGNLAVSNGQDASNPYGNYGDIAIYSQAQGSPTMYYSSHYAFGFCGYDNAGNLYLAATKAYDRRPQLVRFSEGSASFVPIKVRKPIYAYDEFTPSVQWNGSSMTISSTTAMGARSGASGTISIYALKISADKAAVSSITKLKVKGNAHTGQSWIFDGAVAGIYYNKDWGNVGIWSYPGRGNPIQKITKIANLGTAILRGVTVSIAPSR